MKELTTMEKFAQGEFVRVDDYLIQLINPNIQKGQKQSDVIVYEYNESIDHRFCYASKIALHEGGVSIFGKDYPVMELSEDDKRAVEMIQYHKNLAESRFVEKHAKLKAEKIRDLTYFDNPIIGIYPEFQSGTLGSLWLLYGDFNWIILRYIKDEYVGVSGSRDSLRVGEWMIHRNPFNRLDELFKVVFLDEIKEQALAISYPIKDEFRSAFRFKVNKQGDEWVLGSSSNTFNPRKLTKDELKEASKLDEYISEVEHKFEEMFFHPFSQNLYYNNFQFIGIFPDVSECGVEGAYILARNIETGETTWLDFSEIRCPIEDHVEVPDPENSDFSKYSQNLKGRLFNILNSTYLILDDFTVHGKRFVALLHDKDSQFVSMREFAEFMKYGELIEVNMHQMLDFYRNLKLEHRGEIGEVTFTSNDIIFVPENENRPAFRISQSALRDLKLPSYRAST